MHTFLVVLMGLALLLLFFEIAKLLKLSFRRLLPLYFVVWLFGAAINMWIGISQAGYSFREELPIFLIVFGVPSVIAFLLARKGY